MCFFFQAEDGIRDRLVTGVQTCALPILGKLNYCLKALKNKGLIKIKNFKKNPNKLNYIYILTPKGVSATTKLTINFMKRKMKEYDELKKEIDS